MKKIEIIQLRQHDLTIFWIYEKIYGVPKRLRGINYHCGVDAIDGSFAVEDEELTKIYVNRFKGNLEASKIDIAVESIYEEINKEHDKHNRNNFEKAFYEFLQEQRSSLDFKDEKEKNIIRDVINDFLDKANIE